MNNDYEIKNILLEYLYSKIQISDYRFIEIKAVSDILDIKTNKYYIAPNFGGIWSFLIFIKHNNKNLCYTIDRRTISFNRKTLQLEKVRINKLELSVDENLYDGTIFDCYILDTQYNGKSQIVITDIFYYASRNLLMYNYKKKMLLISNKQYYENDNKTIVYVSPVFELNQMDILFKDYIKSNIKKLNIKGISLYKEISSTKLIYVFNRIENDNDYKEKLMNDDIEVNKENDNNISDDNKIGKKRITFELSNIEKINEEIILNMEVEKTYMPDIYKLYCLFKENDKIIKKNIGISLIPSYEFSIQCKENFVDKRQIMRCKFNPYKKKWMMLDKTDNKMDIINIDKRLVINYEII